jgi:hypothetical protein
MSRIAKAFQDFSHKLASTGLFSIVPQCRNLEQAWVEIPPDFPRHRNSPSPDAIGFFGHRSQVSNQGGFTMFLRPSNLYRAFFCAVGLVMIIVGLECLAIDSAMLAPGILEDAKPLGPDSNGWFSSQPSLPQGKIFRPRDWFPWSMLAGGSIVAIYAQAVRTVG